jgi:heat shock protein HslJ
MAQIGVTGIVWRALRGIGATIALAACGGAGGPTQGPAEATPAPTVAHLRHSWTAVSLQHAGEPAVLAPESRLVADFGDDGDLYIQADCNVCSAGYEASADGSLEVVGPVPCTLAFCSSAPLDSQFLALLEAARSWSVEGETLELSSEAGVVVLTRT